MNNYHARLQDEHADKQWRLILTSVEVSLELLQYLLCDKHEDSQSEKAHREQFVSLETFKMYYCEKESTAFRLLDDTTAKRKYTILYIRKRANVLGLCAGSWAK